MRRTNAEVLREAIEAMNRRDAAASVELMHEEGEWRPLLTAGGELERPVYRGPEGIVRYWRELDELFDEFDIHVEAIEDLGGGLLLFEGRVLARGRASGVPLDTHLWALWRVRDGKVLHGTAFRTREDVLAAAQDA